MLIERDCFELAEVAEALDLTPPVIRECVGSGRLRLSVRLVAQLVSLSYWEVDEDGRPFSVPLGDEFVTRVADLSVSDAYALVRSGERQVYSVEFEDQMIAQLRRGEGLPLTTVDALVRREYLERFAVGTATQTGGKGASFGNPFDFRRFEYKGELYKFTYMQAQALRYMYECCKAGAPDQHFNDILRGAGSESPKLGSLFRRRPDWVKLVQAVPDHRGYYSLDPQFASWLRKVAE